MTHKDCKFEWNEQCEDAFIELKQKLSQTPLLYHYLSDEYCLILDVDASNLAIGCCVDQVIDGKERPMAYGSHTLTLCQRNWCVFKKELYAVVFYCDRYSQWLLGRHFYVRTDHRALCWLLEFKESQGILARWQIKLSKYDFAIIHRAGKSHGNADALSRKPLASGIRKCN